VNEKCTCLIRLGNAGEGNELLNAWIDFCPLHAAAPQLLEACERARDALLATIEHDMREGAMEFDEHVHYIEWDKLDKAIAAAKGEK
jgi:hypothetical protein